MGREPGKGVGMEAWKGTWKKGIWKGNLERNPGKGTWKGSQKKEPEKRIFKLSLESNPVQLGNQESWIVNGN